MARSTIVEKVVTVRNSRVLPYTWPEGILSVLLFLLFVCSAITLGSFAYFEYVRKRLFDPVPWYYYFLIVTTCLSIAFILIVMALYYLHLLLPIIVLPIAFILFVFWLIGLVKSSIDLWGPLGSINDNCVRYVYNEGFWGGRTLDTIARIQQEGMCNLWKTSFAMEMIATFVLLWIFVLAIQVIIAARRGYNVPAGIV